MELSNNSNSSDVSIQNTQQAETTAPTTSNVPEEATQNFNRATYEENTLTDAKAEYPEGFDANLYNLETKSLRTDKVKELLDYQQAQIKDLTSQKDNLRRIISKGKAPVDLSQYNNYKPDSKYEKFYQDDDTKSFMNNFNKVANNLGLNIDQHKAILDFFNSELEQKGVIDTRTDAEKQLQEQDWRREQYKKLGDGAEYLIKRNMDFIDKYNFINEEQKEALKQFANSSASNLMIVQRFREVLDQNINEESPIPTMNVSNSGIADDRTLWLEFTNEKTPDIRKEQIIQERMKAGRPAEWQI